MLVCMQLLQHSFTSLATLSLGETSHDCITVLRAYASIAVSVIPLCIPG